MIVPPRVLLFGILLSPGLLLLSGCGKKEEGQEGGGQRRGGGKVAVLVAEVQKKPVPVTLKSVGSVLPPTTVLVKPQVTGEIAEIHFKEGQEVEAGADLFTINVRPYQAALEKSNADLEKAKAVAADAELRASNFAKLDRTSQGSVARDEVNRFQASAASARADVLAAEAAVKSAQLLVEYCKIKSPQAGRTGAVLVDPGNIVQANITDLVVINQMAPAEVTFSLAGRYLNDLNHYMKQAPLKVEAIPEGTQHKATGEVIFINNQVNRAAGTIELRGLFQNGDRTLWPGQFVDVKVFLTTEPDRVVAPARAVQTGLEGPFVFLVKEDLTAAVRPVKVARAAGDEVVIAEGLAGGERLVVDGQAQLADGAKVDIKSALDDVLKGKGGGGKPPESKPPAGKPAGNSPAGATQPSGT